LQYLFPHDEAVESLHKVLLQLVRVLPVWAAESLHKSVLGASCKACKCTGVLLQSLHVYRCTPCVLPAKPALFTASHACLLPRPPQGQYGHWAGIKSGTVLRWLDEMPTVRAAADALEDVVAKGCSAAAVQAALDACRRLHGVGGYIACHLVRCYAYCCLHCPPAGDDWLSLEVRLS
jgi:hypothetical protein